MLARAAALHVVACRPSPVVYTQSVPRVWGASQTKTITTSKQKKTYESAPSHSPCCASKTPFRGRQKISIACQVWPQKPRPHTKTGTHTHIARAAVAALRLKLLGGRQHQLSGGGRAVMYSLVGASRRRRKHRVWRRPRIVECGVVLLLSLSGVRGGGKGVVLAAWQSRLSKVVRFCACMCARLWCVCVCARSQRVAVGAIVRPLRRPPAQLCGVGPPPRRHRAHCSLLRRPLPLKSASLLVVCARGRLNTHTHTHTGRGAVQGTACRALCLPRRRCCAFFRTPGKSPVPPRAFRRPAAPCVRTRECACVGSRKGLGG